MTSFTWKRGVGFESFAAIFQPSVASNHIMSPSGFGGRSNRLGFTEVVGVFHCLEFYWPIAHVASVLRSCSASDGGGGTAAMPPRACRRNEELESLRVSKLRRQNRSGDCRDVNLYPLVSGVQLDAKPFSVALVDRRHWPRRFRPLCVPTALCMRSDIPTSVRASSQTRRRQGRRGGRRARNED